MLASKPGLHLFAFIDTWNLKFAILSRYLDSEGREFQSPVMQPYIVWSPSRHLPFYYGIEILIEYLIHYLYPENEVRRRPSSTAL